MRMMTLSSPNVLVGSFSSDKHTYCYLCDLTIVLTRVSVFLNTSENLIFGLFYNHIFINNVLYNMQVHIHWIRSAISFEPE